MPETHAGKLDLLALAVARGETVADASKALGLPERTAYRWAGRDEFKARVEGLRREMLAGAVGKLTDAAVAAVGTLVELLGAGNPPTVRCSAARSLLSTLIDVQGHYELAERIAELERKVADDQSEGAGGSADANGWGGGATFART